MCCCAKPTRNGEPGYSWDGHLIGVRPIDAPELSEGQVLLYDEPGRCGGIDSHCHHYRVVKDYGHMKLLARNGLGTTTIDLSIYAKMDDPFAELNSNSRYWILNALYHAQQDAALQGRDQEREAWQVAAAEGRIKTRKLRGKASKRVWIEPVRELAEGHPHAKI